MQELNYACSIKEHFIDIKKCLYNFIRRLQLSDKTVFIFREEFDNNFLDDPNADNATVELKPALEVYRTISRFLIIYKKERDQERIERVCR